MKKEKKKRGEHSSLCEPTVVMLMGLLLLSTNVLQCDFIIIISTARQIYLSNVSSPLLPPYFSPAPKFARYYVCMWCQQNQGNTTQHVKLCVDFIITLMPACMSLCWGCGCWSPPVWCITALSAGHIWSFYWLDLIRLFFTCATCLTLIRFVVF